MGMETITISNIINMIKYDGNSIPWQGRMLFNMRNTSTSVQCVTIKVTLEK